MTRLTRLVPVHARALDTQRDAQVDAGPLGFGLATVTAGVVPADAHELL